MCQEKLEAIVLADGLKKILVDLKAGKYSFNQEDPTFKIARETLNKVFKGSIEAASFSTACRFEEMLIKAHIGTPPKERDYRTRVSRPHREIAA